MTQAQYEQVEEKAHRADSRAKQHYNRTAHPLPDIQVQSQVALQSPRTKLWDVYGEVIAVGPHRQYTIKTSSGAVLIRNRRFLRRRTPLSSPPQQIQSTQPPEQQAPPASSTPLRRSGRVCRRPQRLIEDPTWQGPN